MKSSSLVLYVLVAIATVTVRVHAVSFDATTSKSCALAVPRGGDGEKKSREELKHEKEYLEMLAEKRANRFTLSDQAKEQISINRKVAAMYRERLENEARERKIANQKKRLQKAATQAQGELDKLAKMEADKFERLAKLKAQEAKQGVIDKAKDAHDAAKKKAREAAAAAKNTAKETQTYAKKVAKDETELAKKHIKKRFGGLFQDLR